MKALAFWKRVTVDDANLLDRLVSLLDEEGIPYCVIGGQGVNAYVEPVVSLYLDLVVAVDEIERVESLLRQHFKVERFPHSLNVSLTGSDLRVQIQLDSRYGTFVDNASVREVLGIGLPVARMEERAPGEGMGCRRFHSPRQQATEGSRRHRAASGKLSPPARACPRSHSRSPGLTGQALPRHGVWP